MNSSERFCVFISRYIEETDTEIEIKVVGDFYPEVPAHRSGHPDNWEPGECSETFIESSVTDSDEYIELTEEEIAEVERLAEDHVKQSQAQHMEDLAEQRYHDSKYHYWDDPF